MEVLLGLSIFPVIYVVVRLVSRARISPWPIITFALLTFLGPIVVAIAFALWFLGGHLPELRRRRKEQERQYRQENWASVERARY